MNKIGEWDHVVYSKEFTTGVIGAIRSSSYMYAYIET